MSTTGMLSQSTPGDGPPLGKAGRSAPNPGDGVGSNCSPGLAAAGAGVTAPILGVTSAGPPRRAGISQGPAGGSGCGRVGPAGAATCCSNQRWYPSALSCWTASQSTDCCMPGGPVRPQERVPCRLGGGSRCRDLGGGGSKCRPRHIRVGVGGVGRLGDARTCGRRQGRSSGRRRLGPGLGTMLPIIIYDEAIRLRRPVPHGHILPMHAAEGAHAIRITAVPVLCPSGQALRGSAADVPRPAFLAGAGLVVHRLLRS